MSEHISGQARNKTRIEEFVLLKLTYFLWFIVGLVFFSQAPKSDSDRA